mgnify:CR=1 FL=1
MSMLLLTSLGFAIEYLLRIWIAPDNPGAGQRRARAACAMCFRCPGLVDLVAAIPFALAPHFGLNLDWLDIVPIFKLLRHTAAFQFMVEAVYSERRVLWSAAVLMLVLLVFQSSLVYYFEREAQPDKYGSIPGGDVVGHRHADHGRLRRRHAGDACGARSPADSTAVMGLCMFAIPVGIIASALHRGGAPARVRRHLEPGGQGAAVPHAGCGAHRRGGRRAARAGAPSAASG